MTCWRRKVRPRCVVATVLAMVWLPYAGTRCLENPAGPPGAAGSVNCIFGHHAEHRPADGHHHSPAHRVGGDPTIAEPVHDHGHASADTGRRRDHRRDDTCCNLTGKYSVIPSVSAASGPPVAVASAWNSSSWHRPLAHYPEQRALAPVAHSPPIYLRNATLLI